jgi:hypothetical protein
VNQNFLFSNWKLPNHIEKMIPTLIGACYAVWLMVQISNINTLKSIYCAYLHSIIKFRIIILGDSSNNGKTFTLQKKIVRIIVSVQSRTSCRSLFKQLDIVTVPSQYTILIWGIDQMPTYLVFKKVHFMLATKFFNSLPCSLTTLNNEQPNLKHP